jgi:hypothetical protein
VPADIKRFTDMEMHISVIAVAKRIHVAMSNPASLIVPTHVESLLLRIRPRQIGQRPVQPSLSIRQFTSVDAHPSQECFVRTKEVVDHTLVVRPGGEGHTCKRVKVLTMSAPDNPLSGPPVI